MSVLRSKRHLSRYEFEHNYIQFYNYTTDIMSKTPKRRRKYLCEPLSKQINIIFNWIMTLNENIYAKNDKGKLVREQAIIKSIDEIYNIEKVLMVYWNVMKIPFKKMCNWCEYLNKEIALLNGIMKETNTLEEKECSKHHKKQRNLFVLDWNKINKVDFLKNMSDLHRYTHGKTIRAVKDFENGTTPLIISLIDDALYNVMTANACYPQTKEEYEIRSGKIKRAINDLNRIQIPLLSYFDIMQYSNKTQEEWSGMIVNEIKLLQGLQKSDKKRFGNL